MNKYDCAFVTFENCKLRPLYSINSKNKNC